MSSAPKTPGSALSWLKLGTVGKAHGLRGSFFISGRDELIPREYGEVVIGDDPERGLCCKLLDSRWQSGRPVISCAEIKDRTAAESHTGKTLWVKRQHVPVNAESEFLWSDLIGKLVCDIKGRCLGHVTDIYNLGASDNLVVQSAEGRHLHLPIIAEYIAIDTQWTNRKHIDLLVDGAWFDEFWTEA